MKGLSKYTKMKTTFFLWASRAFLFILVVSFQGCGKSDLERNPYLPEIKFTVPVDLSLPQYDNLRYAGGALLLPQYGHKGIILFNLNGTTYFAWEASCPHHAPSNCSQTQINGVLTTCACEDYQYSLATGQLINPDEGQTTIYSLVNYRLENQGTRLIISN